MGVRSILIVDNDSANRAGLAELFHDAGLTVYEEAGADDALSFLEEHMVDVVLADTHLNERGDFFARCFSKYPYLPIAGMSVDARVDRHEMLSVGVRVVLLKPIENLSAVLDLVGL